MIGSIAYQREVFLNEGGIMREKEFEQNMIEQMPVKAVSAQS